METEEKIQELEAEIKECHENLKDEEKEILKKVLAIHAQNIHLKKPQTSKEIIKIVEGRIK